MRIDAHHHLWDLSSRPQPWTVGLPPLQRSFLMAELSPALDRHEIEATVVVQTVCEQAETRELLAAAVSEERIRGVVGWVDLTSPDIGESIEALRLGPGGEHLVGLRHQVQDEPDDAWLTRSDVRRGLAAVGAADLAYDIVVKRHQLPAVVDTVAALPNVRFVLDHGGKPAIASGELEPWRSHISALGRLPNVACKLSGLITEAAPHDWRQEDLRPYTTVLLDAFTPSRILFGSDWPVCLLNGSYDEVVASADAVTRELDELERADVFGRSAARWYGISR